jgi:SHS2 domain-containing protein
MFELCDHTADLGIRARAASLDGLMAEAARGFAAVLVADPDRIEPREAETFRVAGTDPAWLLRDWIAELHAAFELRRMLFGEFAVSVGESGLTATARGEPFDPRRHELAHEIKAVTQHDLTVRRTAAGWEGFLLVDI